MEIKNKKIAVVGAGRSGLAAVRYCLSMGGLPFLNDRLDRGGLGEALAPFEKLGIPLRLGGHNPKFFADADAVILSPGVPPDLEVFSSLGKRGIPITNEIEIAGTVARAPIIAVTGTNGKSTTVTLIHEMLVASGKRSALGGNIGLPFLDLVHTDAESFVIEVSSYQLELVRTFRPRIGVLLNITPDHMGRHKNMEGYIRAKARLFMNEEKDDWAIYNADDPSVTIAVSQTKGKKVPWSLRQEIEEGISLRGKRIIFRKEEYDLTNFSQGGIHNIHNAMAAIAAARLGGAGPSAIQQTLDDLRGLPHRFERVGNAGGITFINDSKATNIGAAVAAVLGIPKGKLILLAGGEDKGSPYEPLKEAIVRQEGKFVVAFGEAAGIIGNALNKTTPLARTTTLKEAFYKALEAACPGDFVLLAPACASFDQFRNFEERGESFRGLVNELMGKHNGICT